MRAAIYARYSSDLQSASSIEDQIRLCREVMEREGAQAVEIYTDYALSGGALKTRPGMQALLADLRAKGFDLVSPKHWTGSAATRRILRPSSSGSLMRRPGC
ncbi:recombinase family protein [Limimaricola variabilis]|uniref:recombinase family protein n=1 Tax=Limimaricola variabilis TaxID=1492771 RepID=UPI002AC9889F|nr:recombinase family protein [Limimaricola variabilis]WPY94969.1 recombinase family protein [Limimaricola variabilis]